MQSPTLVVPIAASAGLSTVDLRSKNEAENSTSWCGMRDRPLSAWKRRHTHKPVLQVGVRGLSTFITDKGIVYKWLASQLSSFQVPKSCSQQTRELARMLLSNLMVCVKKGEQSSSSSSPEDSTEVLYVHVHDPWSGEQLKATKQKTRKTIFKKICIHYKF